MIDWDDLRFVLAVARAGSALRAAKILNVNQTTVARRVARIEAAIGADLFEARRDGYRLTPLGEMVAAGAERIDAEMRVIQNAIEAKLRLVSGSIRFTSAEVVANRIVAPFLREFRRQYPEVIVELIADDRQLDVARGEADVALRASARPEGGGLVAQRLPGFAWAAYCSGAYADEHGLPATIEELNSHAVIAMDSPTSRGLHFRWLTVVAEKAPISARSNSLTNLVSAVKAGLGVGMLPCFVGDTEPDLLRCLPPVRELDAESWLIVREDIRHAPHVRAFVDALAAHMATLRGHLSGESPLVRPRGDALA
ncbi:MAG: LysR family transcriptional regulator [Pseudolabrys sp.]